MSEPSEVITPASPPSGRAGIESWIDGLGSADGMERRAARGALVGIGRPAVLFLIRSLKDSRAHVRWEAAKALADIADPGAAAALVIALEDEESGVRWLAAEGLIALGSLALPELLGALTERAESARLREGAHHVLHELPIWKLARLLSPVIDALEHAAPESRVPVAASAALDSMRRGG